MGFDYVTNYYNQSDFIKVILKKTVIYDMASIEIKLNDLNNYINSNGNLAISQKDSAELISIFNACDTVSENGAQGADGKLTNDEVPKFFQQIKDSMKNIVQNFLMATNEDYAKEAKANSPQSTSNSQNNKDVRGYSTETIPLKINEQEKQKYDETLAEAKDVLIKNKDNLKLTDEEIKYIQSASTESIEVGSARYAPDKDQINFNYNDYRPETCSVGNFVKVLLHEVNHAVTKEPDTQEQERECETKAIARACKLYEHGAIGDASIYQSRNSHKIYNLSDLTNSSDLNNFIETWLDECDYRQLQEQ